MLVELLVALEIHKAEGLFGATKLKCILPIMMGEKDSGGRYSAFPFSKVRPRAFFLPLLTSRREGLVTMLTHNTARCAARFCVPPPLQIPERKWCTACQGGEGGRGRMEGRGGVDLSVHAPSAVIGYQAVAANELTIHSLQARATSRGYLWLTPSLAGFTTFKQSVKS